MGRKEKYSKQNQQRAPPNGVLNYTLKVLLPSNGRGSKDRLGNQTVAKNRQKQIEKVAAIDLQHKNH